MNIAPKIQSEEAESVMQKNTLENSLRPSLYQAYKPTTQIKTDTNVLQKACEFIKLYEGLSLVAYVCPAGKLTIGYGHTEGVRKGQKITKEQAQTMLEQDVKKFYDFVCKEVGGICNSNQIAALTSFAYNTGVENFKESTLLKVIKTNSKNFTEIRKQFDRWVYAGKTGAKKVLEGLVTRRKAEADLYCS